MQIRTPNGATRVFFKPKMPQNDLFFDPWPLTFWPMTSPFGDLLAITKTHLGYKFHQDPPMGTWWKVVDSLTHSLTHWLTKSLLMGERCHPKSIIGHQMTPHPPNEIFYRPLFPPKNLLSPPNNPPTPQLKIYFRTWFSSINIFFSSTRPPPLYCFFCLIFLLTPPPPSNPNFFAVTPRHPYDIKWNSPKLVLHSNLPSFQTVCSVHIVVPLFITLQTNTLDSHGIYRQVNNNKIFLRSCPTNDDQTLV